MGISERRPDVLMAEDRHRRMKPGATGHDRRDGVPEVVEGEILDPGLVPDVLDRVADRVRVAAMDRENEISGVRLPADDVLGKGREGNDVELLLDPAAAFGFRRRDGDRQDVVDDVGFLQVQDRRQPEPGRQGEQDQVLEDRLDRAERFFCLHLAGGGGHAFDLVGGQGPPGALLGEGRKRPQGIVVQNLVLDGLVEQVPEQLHIPVDGGGFQAGGSLGLESEKLPFELLDVVPGVLV